MTTHDTSPFAAAARIAELEAERNHYQHLMNVAVTLREREVRELNAHIAALEASDADYDRQLQNSQVRVSALLRRIAELEAAQRDYEAEMMPSMTVRIAELEAAVDEIARQHTLAEGEAEWLAEREGEKWIPDVESAYDDFIEIARRVSRARPAP